MAVDRRLINDLLSGAALIFIMFAALISLPVIGLSIGLLAPLPISYYLIKIGRKYGVLILAVVTALISSLAGMKAGALFLAEFASMGIALSEAIRMKLPLGRGVLLAGAATLAGSFLLLTTVSFSVDKGLVDTVKEQLSQNVKDTIEAYKKVGLPDDQVKSLTEFTERLESVILKVFPSLVLVGTFSVALMNLLALNGLLKKKGIGEYRIEPTTWQSPEIAVWVLITGGSFLLLKNEWLGTAGLNLLIVTGIIYLFQGMAIVAFYFKKMETPLFLRMIGYLLIFFQQMFTITVIGLGLFDLWFDFRRLKKEA